MTTSRGRLGRANLTGMLLNMGYWGVKSYENDDADDALDAGFDHVHGTLYEELMDDRNPLSFEQVQKRLADARTLAAAVAALEELVGATLDGDPESLGRGRPAGASPAWSYATPSWAWRSPRTWDKRRSTGSSRKTSSGRRPPSGD